MAWDPAISKAFESGNAEEFSRLLRLHPEFIRAPDGTDMWMWRAAMGGNLSLVKALVELGMDVNESNDRESPDEQEHPFAQGEGSILQAAGEGHLEVVQWLLEHGAQINCVVNGKRRCLPLVWAAEGGHFEIVKVLVEHGADVNAVWNGSNAITLAENRGHWEIFDYLRSQGARTLRETTPPDYPATHRMILQQMTERRGQLGDWSLELPGNPGVTLHLIPVNDQCDVQTLFTVGLSDHCLPRGRHQHAGTELCFMLPPEWPLSDAALGDPVWNWPVEWLKLLVNQLRAADRWSDEPVTFMNGDPPAPFAPSTQLCGWLCLQDFDASVWAPDYRLVDIHSLFPIYAEEAALVRQSGHEELVARFEARNIPLHVDPVRPNVATEPDS